MLSEPSASKDAMPKSCHFLLGGAGRTTVKGVETEGTVAMVLPGREEHPGFLPHACVHMATQ